MSSSRSSGRGSGASPTSSSSSSKKRKSGDDAFGSDSKKKRRNKKPRFLWSDDLHERFLVALFEYGLEKVSAQQLFQEMSPSPSTVTEEAVKEHLDNFRESCISFRTVGHYLDMAGRG